MTFVKTVYLGLTCTSVVRLPDGSEALTRQLSHTGIDTFAPSQPLTMGWRTEQARLHPV